MPLSILQTVRNLQKQLQQLDTALMTSFSNLKRDLNNQADTLSRINSKLIEQEKFNKQLIRNIAELQKQQVDTNSLKKSSKEEILREIGKAQGRKTPENGMKKLSGDCSGKSKLTVNASPTPNTKGLTALHMELLRRLMILQIESGKRSISMRDLASDLYPNKAYTTIKATLSEYIKRLHQVGLVEKIHQGRLYLSYTEKALQFADDERLHRMKELISKPLLSVR